jgi:V/A-type H+-transporting ATPase subunit I
MIVPMRHVTLLCVAAEREHTLNALREMGAVHLLIAAADSASFRDTQTRLAACRQAQRVIADVAANKPIFPSSTPHAAALRSIDALLDANLAQLPTDPAGRVDTVLALAEQRQLLVDEAARLEQTIACYQPFGDFDVALPGRLATQGIAVQLFRVPNNVALSIPDGACLQMFGDDAKFAYGVIVGTGALPADCEGLPVPEATVSELRVRRTRVLEQADRIAARLTSAADDTSSLEREALRLTDASAFIAAADTMQSNGPVAWITGWIPADDEERLRTAAEAHAWGLLLRDPEPDEQPPTLLRPPRLFRPILALFDALGISPAYKEADVSVPFFCFFSIFFAMLVGDGAYGVLIVLFTWLARRKFPKTPRTPFVLLTVFACATIVWGILSNTWFGTHPKALENMTSLWLNAPEKGITRMMMLCFTIGVVHLSVARIWNAINLFPDTKFLAQVGWLGVLWFMYCMACNIVGVFSVPTFIYPVFVVSVLLLFFFTLKRSELKTNGIGLGLLPLNIISCLSDIISYVRLFAVGLASVKLAETFNDMAINLGLPLWLKIIPMALILLIGHGLNFAMASLSILVHAVRLNTLEFSNHKGISWSGFAFKPFKRKADAT